MHTWMDGLQHWPVLHTSPCEFYNMWSSYGNRKSSASPHRSTFSQLHTWIRKNVRTTDVTSSHKELPDHISCRMCWNWASRTPGRLCTEAGQKPGLGSEDLMKVCVLSIALIEVGIRNVILKIMTRFVDSMKMQDVPSTISWSIHVLPRHAHVCRYKLQSSLSTYKRGAMALNEPLQHQWITVPAGNLWGTLANRSHQRTSTKWCFHTARCISTKWYKLQVHRRATNTIDYSILYSYICLQYFQLHVLFSNIARNTQLDLSTCTSSIQLQALAWIGLPFPLSYDVCGWPISSPH